MLAMLTSQGLPVLPVFEAETRRRLRWTGTGSVLPHGVNTLYLNYLWPKESKSRDVHSLWLFAEVSAGFPGVERLAGGSMLVRCSQRQVPRSARTLRARGPDTGCA